jgi:UDP-N-acetylmuramoylalanine--D-glutamate ligase
MLRNSIEKSEEQIISAIKKFKGLRHRMQLLGEIDGVKFINDSKATNAESTENSLKAYDKIFWILGGKSKEGGISTLTPFFHKIHKAYLIGDASEEFAKTLKESSVAFEKCGDLKNAFKKAFFDAKNISLSEKNILLSPACASFDQWKNFEERGDFFCKTFDELQT